MPASKSEKISDARPRKGALEEKDRLKRVRGLTREQRCVELDGEEGDIREDAHAAKSPAKEDEEGKEEVSAFACPDNGTEAEKGRDKLAHIEKKLVP